MRLIEVPALISNVGKRQVMLAPEHKTVLETVDSDVHFGR